LSGKRVDCDSDFKTPSPPLKYRGWKRDLKESEDDA